MDYLLSKKFDGTFTMDFIGVETLTPTDNIMHLKPTAPVIGIKKITSYTDNISGIIDSSQYLKVMFKYQNKYDNDNAECGDCWSDLLPISSITGITCIPSQPFDIELFYFRVDDKIDNLDPTNIYVGSDVATVAIEIDGEYEFNYTDGAFTLTDTITEVVLVPKEIYKIFSISNFQIITDGDISSLELHWRVTQDNGRTYSKWEPLTTANISTYRFNHLRFARVEYKVKSTYPVYQPINVYDIILTGDFQNVSANSLKTNRYGIRQDCLTGLIAIKTGTVTGTTTDICGSNIDTGLMSYAPGNGSYSTAMTPYDLNMNYYTQGLSCYSTMPLSSTSGTNSVAGQLTAQNQTNSGTLWQPYDINKIMDLANMLANQTNSIFAWEIDYHLTDPDSNGTDFILHEYQLFNVVEIKKLKVFVPDNKFPDNMVKMNAFSLDLFDTFEIHILKDEFKRVFGIDRRPSENDIISFCMLNRLYYIKHAQVFREIMGAGIYYKVILEKYEQKANIRNLSEESKPLLDLLTKNTTMEELMGVERKDNEDKDVNIEQFKPFTFDVMRYVVNKGVVRVRQDIMNGNIDFAKNYYDFKDVIGKTAIIYKKTDNVISGSSNRAFVCWFNFNNGWNVEKPNKNASKEYAINQTTNFWFLNNFDTTTNKGYRIWYHKNKINFQVNDQYYQIVNPNLLTNIWYGMVINLDQRQQVVDMKIYQRDCNYNIIMMHPNTYQIKTIDWLDTTEYTNALSAGYLPVDNQEVHSVETQFKIIKENYYDSIDLQTFEHEVDLTIEGTNIKYTNLRVFNDVIPVEEMVNTLNQFIIRDAQKLILADNADKNIYTDNYVNKNWV